jgi:glycosyltransferase involved in cell wall biosynthesis
MSLPGVSVVICCYNGAKRLRETVKYIALQKVPSGLPWEFILVDNASSDNSAQVVRDSWAEFNGSSVMRIVYEPKQGLSTARARGFLEAKFDFILLCDDDNWLDNNYVSIAFSVMQEKSNVAVLGGHGTLQYEISPRDWMQRIKIFASGAQAAGTGHASGMKVYGAGCVIRKSAMNYLNQAGFQSLLTDRNGNELSSGGDYELCYALSMAGFDIWYDERLRFTHFITKERLTWNYFSKYARESILCYDVLFIYKAIVERKAATYHIMISREYLYCLRHYLVYFCKKKLVSESSSDWKVWQFYCVLFSTRLYSFYTQPDTIKRNYKNVIQLRDLLELRKKSIFS